MSETPCTVENLFMADEFLEEVHARHPRTLASSSNYTITSPDTGSISFSAGNLDLPRDLDDPRERRGTPWNLLPPEHGGFGSGGIGGLMGE